MRRSLRERDGYVERFNRTLEEEFIEYREWMLKDDLEEFNRELMRYLIWYNTERVHSGLGNVSPLEWICYKFYENSPQSKIIWTYTLY
ncbi:MAG: integrase core domain-containing protein [Caldimicrobium sp.]|nr:integrase core domain-containing protein [Caldimicrobium sp.]